jgi:hypothetical protein
VSGLVLMEVEVRGVPSPEVVRHANAKRKARNNLARNILVVNLGPRSSIGDRSSAISAKCFEAEC